MDNKTITLIALTDYKDKMNGYLGFCKDLNKQPSHQILNKFQAKISTLEHKMRA